MAAFNTKDWADTPGTATPLSAAAMEDLEMRTTDYAGTVSPGVNVWESVANGGTVTDWGPVVNSLLTTGYRRLIFNENDFPFSTTMSIPTGATFEGASGMDWGFQDEPTRLLWGGTGSGIAVDCSGETKDQIWLKDLVIGYDDPGFAGTLVSMNGGNGSGIENCVLKNIRPTAGMEASVLLDCDGLIGGYFRRMLFRGAQTLVRGYGKGALSDDSNQITFRDCIFEEAEDFMINSPGYEWLLDNCCFEFDGCGTAVVGVGSSQASQFAPSVFTLCGQSSFWDADAATQVAIKQPVGIEWGVAIRDTSFRNGTRSNPDIDLQGTGWVEIDNVMITGGTGTPSIDLGDVGSNGNSSRKRRVSIRNSDVGQGLEFAAITNLVGHGAVEIENVNKSGLSRPQSPQVRAIGGYERNVGYLIYQLPTLSVHAGYSAPTGMISDGQALTDGYGVIILNTNTGNAPAGVALDVTFAEPLVPAYREGNETPPFLHVELTPMTIPTTAPDGDAAAAAGLYAYVANSTAYTDSVEHTSFSIGFAAEIPSGNTFAIAYRVLQL